MEQCAPSTLVQVWSSCSTAASIPLPVNEGYAPVVTASSIDPAHHPRHAATNLCQRERFCSSDSNVLRSCACSTCAACAVS